MFRNTSQTSQAAMNMLFNAERPRFDSHLRSARLLPQRATGASAPLATATQQPVSWVPSFRFRWLPRCACAATGRERLDSRFLSSRAVRAAGRQGSRAAGLSQSSRTLSPESRPRDPAPHQLGRGAASTLWTVTRPKRWTLQPLAACFSRLRSAAPAP